MTGKCEVGQLLPEIEDFIKLVKVQHASNQDCHKAFLSYVEIHDKCRNEWIRKENDMLEQIKTITKEKEKQLKIIMKEKDNLEARLKLARKFLDEEKLQRKRAEDDRYTMESQLQEIRNLLQDNRNKLHDETREKLQYLSTIDQRLSTINESMYHDTTGSCLSDLSYSRSEDDLDVDSIRFSRKLRKSHGTYSTDGVGTVAKRRRSSANTGRSEVVRAGPGECLVATTRVDMGNAGTPVASSIIETFPSSTASLISPLCPVKPSAPADSGESELGENCNKMDKCSSNKNLQSPGNGFFPFGMNMINTKTHSLINKTIIKPENCDLCGKKIKFGRVSLKCSECRSVCHVECKDKLRLPCIPPGSGTPTGKDNFGTLADYAPPSSPMIPAIVVHCVNEVEKRGFSEVGIYRVPGSDKEIKALKERFMRGRGVPNLSLISEIHVITSYLKEFFRSLQEPLVTFTQRPKFVEVVQNTDLEARRAGLYQCFSELPQPNRDTLAYLILHLQRVAEVPKCRMPIASLAQAFGICLIGYSRPDPEMISMHMFEETRQSIHVMEELLSIPSEYWRNVLVRSNPTLPCTPSTGSLRDHCGFFDSPTSSGWYTVRKKKP